ncbi:MAG: 30S ribosomal protein S16 [Bacteroidales bacterium]|nr:30S ribosomal protein S16 [Bacteroidales bacterium]MCF8402782.1 30S ribosomal protein S16 [Bacteroidales bacterium]
MPTKIRLQRQGKKGQAFYHIVIADGRAPRDGRYIERIGTYNPLTKPADIKLDFDRALYWLQAGAQPTDTMRSILSYKGVMYKNHLSVGVKKGALTEEQAEAKFASWLKDKEDKIEGKVKELASEERNEAKKRLDAEKEVNEARAKEIAARKAEILKAEEAKKIAAAKAELGEEAVAEPPVEETTPVETKTEDAVAEEAVVEEKTEETPAEEVKEEAAEEVKAEEKTEEAPEVKAEEPKEEAQEEEPKEEESKEEEKKAE